MSDFIFLRSIRSHVKIILSDIEYIQAMDKYALVYNSSKPLMVTQSLSSLEKQLPGDLFIRIHRSYIVAVKHITVVTTCKAFIKKTGIPIGRRYRLKFRDKVGLTK